MKRTLVTTISWLSSILCAAMGLLWLLSEPTDFWMQTSPPGTIYAFKIRGGEGFLYRLNRASRYPNQGATLVQFPLRVVILCSGLLAFVSAVYLLKGVTVAPGRCSACGYDLRATPDRCPECGAIPAKIRDGSRSD